MTTVPRLFGSTLIALALTATVNAADGIEVGQPFPELALPSIEDGTMHSLAEFRGRKVLLEVFASW